MHTIDELRIEALNIASRTHHCLAPNAEDVVKAAQKYFEFLSNWHVVATIPKQATKKPPAKRAR